MAKFEEAQARLYKDVMICKKCKTKAKASMQKVLRGKLLCKNCGKKQFRPKRKAK
ncbi:hypothetical protein HOD61_00385 [archaeon]|jgi:formylmethanofuran dehydrogenase subunit E|nr:hypothetical protein [archaeon]